MNLQIEKLYLAATKPARRIIGLMSGTSLDGLDIALCTIHGSGQETKLELENFTTMPYRSDFRNQVRQVFAKRDVDQQTLSGLNAYIGRLHAELINQALGSWGVNPDTIDCIASHGQTVYHAPIRLTRDAHYPNSTLQIGDGDHIATGTGIITLSDFRQKHIAMGGEGAPLAAYGDYLLFTDATENRILLNIGGISNFTFLPNRASTQKAYATDLGPGNTLMNQYAFDQYGLEMDEDASIAKKGTSNPRLLQTLLKEPFLNEDFPKTTGPELFNLAYLKKAQQASGTEHISPENVMASLNQFAARAIAEGIIKATSGMSNYAVYVSGGGLHNPLLLNHLRECLPGIKVVSFKEIGPDPDAKEACLFAILANETLAGTPQNVVSIKDSPAVCMGKISLPY